MASQPSLKHPSQHTHPLAGTTVLVTGGTGFTGTHLVRRLVDIGAEVRGIARPSSQIDGDLLDAVAWYRGDVYDADLVREAMDGVEYVFHLATCFREAGLPEQEHWNVHVRSTQLLAEAALSRPGFERFVHVSTIGVHGHVEDPPADEEAPFNPDDVYQKTKLEGERWIRAFADREGLPLAVVRPVAIMGPGDRRLLKLFKFARWGVFPLLDGHDTRYHLIHVEDLVRCMIACAHRSEALGEVFICGHKEATSMVEILRQIGELIGRRVRFVSLPSGPLFRLADGVEWASKRLGIEPPLYRRRLAFFTKDRAFDTSKLQETLDFEYCYDNRSAVRDTARSYIDAGWL